MEDRVGSINDSKRSLRQDVFNSMKAKSDPFPLPLKIPSFSVRLAFLNKATFIHCSYKMYINVGEMKNGICLAYDIYSFANEEKSQFRIEICEMVVW